MNSKANEIKKAIDEYCQSFKRLGIEQARPFNPDEKNTTGGQTTDFQRIQQSFHAENQRLDSLFCRLHHIAVRIKPIIREGESLDRAVEEEGIVSEFENQLFYLRNSNNNLSEVISHLEEIFGTK